MKKLLIILALVALSCAKNAPANLSPTGIKVWQANEVVNVIGAVQHAAISFNAQTVCSTDAVPVCGPMLSTANTRLVVAACSLAIQTITKYPDGWYATGLAALTQIEANLGAAGETRLLPYLSTVHVVLASLSESGT